MSACARYMPSLRKVAIRIGRRSVLASFDDAMELLADLQVVFHERNIENDVPIGGDDDGEVQGVR